MSNTSTSTTKKNSNQNKNKIIVPEMKKSTTKKSNRDTNSSSVDARLAVLGFQRASNQRRVKKASNNQAIQKREKYFMVDTFDAANPLDHLKGEFGSDKFENMTEQKLADYVLRQASLVSFPDRETPEEAFKEDEIKAKFEAKGIQVSDDFRDPYDTTAKLRFHDAGRHNGIIYAVLSKFAIYAVGTDFPHIVLDTNRSYPDKDMEKEELIKMSFNFVYYRIKNELEKMDRLVDLRKALYSTVVNAKQYGRACHLIQDDPETGLPVSLKCLSSMRLGRVYTNSLDWDSIEGVQYLDFKKDQSVIFKENMIYAINRNFHQSPNSYNYGLSDIEPVKYLVELNTIIDSMDLKQINKRKWAPMLDIVVASDNKRAVSQLRDAYKRFTSVFTTIPHTVEHIPNDHDGEFLIKEREKNDVKIAEDMGMPLLLLGKELPNTRATASQILQGFNNTITKDTRIWLRSIFEHQWYGRNIIKIIQKLYDEFKSGQKDPIVEEEREIFDKYIERAKEKKKNEIKSLIRQSPLFSMLNNFNRPTPFNNPLSTTNNPSQEQQDQEEEEEPKQRPNNFNRNRNNNNEDREQEEEQQQPTQPQQQDTTKNLVSKIDSIIDDKIEEQFRELIVDEQKTFDKLIQYEKPEDLPFKVKITFDKVSFDTDLEKSANITGLLDKEIIDLEKAQDELDYDDMIEKTKTKEQAEEILQEILVELRQDIISNTAPNMILPNPRIKEQEEEKQMEDQQGTTTRQSQTPQKGFQNQSLDSIRNRRSTVRTDTTGTS